jgi:YbbR domain-containing protein
MHKIKVKILLKKVRNKISQKKVNRNISSKNKIKWWVTTETNKNEKRSGVSLSLIFTV